MFWIIVVSGFYIYAFYDTGINDAFNSVENITISNGIWAAFMRSLHRYASDGMILAAILHMARNFVFDRYRSFAGFHGTRGRSIMADLYGRDKRLLAGLGQARAVCAEATAEWLDALRYLAHLLARNFLEQGSVNDRFFTLLSLVHIGVPLGAFVIIWIHTQRVPQQRPLRPRRFRLD